MSASLNFNTALLDEEFDGDKPLLVGLLGMTQSLELDAQWSYENGTLRGNIKRNGGKAVIRLEAIAIVSQAS